MFTYCVCILETLIMHENNALTIHETSTISPYCVLLDILLLSQFKKEPSID